MTSRIDPQAFLAFEERHSKLLNKSSQASEIIFYVRSPPLSQLERASDFSRTMPITERQPTDAVLIVLLTDLARHLIRSRTDPYQVRRDRPRSGKALETYFVPSVEYELHFSALSIWQKRYRALPAVLKMGQALHPATLALIETAALVAKSVANLFARSREEYDWLSDDQLAYNAIAARMRLWIAHAANAMQIKAWETRLDTDKRKFIARWTPKSESTPHQILRFDLFYGAQADANRGFGAIPADLVQYHIDRLVKTLESSPSFRGHMAEFYPYADLSMTWIIPGLIRLPASEVSHFGLLHEVKAFWQKIAALRGGQLQASFTTQEGEFRYVTDEQRMLDPLWLQISRAATYLFDTRLILDSSLSAITSPESLSHQHSTSKKIRGGDQCAP